MIHTNKSPLAPASANRAYKMRLRSKYIKHNTLMLPPHHISYFLDSAIRTILPTKISLDLQQTKHKEKR